MKNIKRVRQLSRSNSKLNLNEQHNVRGRPKLKRNNNVNARITPRERSRSRSRMGRPNFKQNTRERSVSRQRSAGTVRLRRSDSQVLGSLQTSLGNRDRPLRHQQKKLRSNTGQKSTVNSRIQMKHRKGTIKKENNQISNVKRGRISKSFRQNQKKSIIRFVKNILLISIS